MRMYRVFVTSYVYVRLSLSIPNKHCKPSVGPPASPPHQLRAVIGRALVALQKVQEHMTGERKPDIGT